MRKNSARSENRAYRDSLVALKDNVTLSVMSIGNVRLHFSRFMSLGDDASFRRELRYIVEKVKVRDALGLYVKDLAKIDHKSQLKVAGGRLASLLQALVRAENARLQEFYLLADRFESEFLYGEFDRALVTLDEVFELTGYSLWLMRNRILVLARAGRLDDMKQYCEECKSRSDDALVRYLLNCFLFLATNPLLHSKRVVFITIDELASAGLKKTSDLLSLILAPSLIVRSQKALDCISTLHFLPLVDQVVLSKQLAANNAAASGQDVASQARVSSAAGGSMRAGNKSQIEEIARQYERGEYLEVIDSITTPTSLSAQDAIAAANLVAKSMEISGSKLGAYPKGPLRDIVIALRGLYSMDPAPSQHIDTLSATALQMHHLSFGASIVLLPYQALPMQYEEVERVFAARKAWHLEAVPSSWLTALTKHGDPLLAHEYASTELPIHRHIKQQIRAACSSGDRSAVYEKLENYRGAAPLKRDFYEIASSSLSRIGDLDTLISICATALADKQTSFSAFPMHALVHHIETSGRAQIDDVIVVNAFVKNFSTDKDYLLNETYEEFLQHKGVERPSEIDALSEDELKMNVLLRDISSVETLDFLNAFTSSNDVRAERIRILDLLVDRGAISQEQHRTEVEEVLLQALVDSAATEFTMHKIDVNDQALRRRLADDVRSMFSLYKSSDDSSAGDYIRVDEEPDGDTTAAALVGDRNTTLQKIYSLVRDAFLYDDKHGLDKNLSTEIRHGFFANLMRSKPEQLNLLVEKDEHGEYKTNQYWRDANELITDAVLDEIDSHFAWFSAEFNSLLGEVEEWMKVTTGLSTDRVFSFPLLGDRFLPMKAFADSIQDSDRLLDFMLGSMWQQTEKHLHEIRERLDRKFRNELDSLFEGLIQRVDVTRGETHLSELLSAIRQARNGAREDVSTVKEWFRRSESLSGQSRTLQEVVAISIECYSRVRSIDVKPSFAADTTLAEISFKGRESKALVVALMNLYENCIRHSGYGKETPVSLHAGPVGAKGWHLRVENPVAQYMERMLLEGGMADTQRRLNDPSFAGLVRTEGGSGLRKVLNQLSAVGDKCELSITLEGGNFIAAIEYDS
jgi:polyhydroxyalkanoate synthesis regulator phasin